MASRARDVPTAPAGRMQTRARCTINGNIIRTRQNNGYKNESQFPEGLSSTTDGSSPCSSCEQGVPWRNDCEYQLMHSIPGWRETESEQHATEPYCPLLSVCQTEDEVARQASECMGDMSLCSLDQRIVAAADILKLTPDLCIVREALARRFFRQFSNQPDPSAKFPCRLCTGDFNTHDEWLAHVT